MWTKRGLITPPTITADAATGQIDLTALPTGDWLNDLLTLATATKAASLRHPRMLDIVSQRTPLGPRAIDYLEHALAILEPAPVDDRTKLETIAVLNALITVFARNELNARRSENGDESARAAYLAQVAAEGKHPRLQAALASAAQEPEGNSDFDRLLRKLPGGLTSAE